MHPISYFGYAGSLLLLFAFGCSPGSSDSGSMIPESIKKLENLHMYPGIEETGSIDFKRKSTMGRISANQYGILPEVVVDQRNRVFILNRIKRIIEVFNSEGTHIADLGGEGKGPGEFLDISSIQIYNDKLYALDNRRDLYNIFTLEPLEYFSSYSIIPNNFDDFPVLRRQMWGPVHVKSDSQFVLRFSDMDFMRPGQEVSYKNPLFSTYYYHILNEKRLLKTPQLLQQKGRFIYRLDWQRFVSYPFFGKSLIAFADNGIIFSAQTADFLFEVYSPEGAYRKAYYYPVKKVPLTKDDILEYYEGEQAKRQGIRELDLPGSWHAVESIMTDDQSRLWVTTFTKDADTARWYVIKPSGEPIGQFEWPKDLPIKYIRNDYIYAVETDKDFIHHVVKYRIVLAA